MFALRLARSATTGLRELTAAGGRPHIHRFRWAAEDPFSNSSLYACRCGVVRCGL